MRYVKYYLALTLLMPNWAYAAAPTRANSYVSNTTIDPSQNNANENALYSYLQTGVDTYAAGSITNTAISGSAGITYSKLSLTGSIVRGDLSSSSFVTLPTGAVFFMVTGSCPTGTTDVSATYANKYVKINATAGTSSGVVLTGTVDSHTLTTPEIPAHTHSVNYRFADDVGNTYGSARTVQGAVTGTFETASAGGGGGHTHTISSATTLEPSSVTMIACQVN